jgi:hypothetical protein
MLLKGLRMPYIVDVPLLQPGANDFLQIPKKGTPLQNFRLELQISLQDGSCKDKRCDIFSYVDLA